MGQEFGSWELTLQIQVRHDKRPESMWTEVVSGQMLAISKAESTGFADSLDVECSKK